MESERIRRILVVDTETTGVNPAVHTAIEVAACLFDIPTNAPISTFASLIYAASNEAEPINRIPVSLLQDAPLADKVWPFVERVASRADCIVAHNADFDRGFVSPALRALPWADSMSDIDWGRGKVGGSLTALALAHDVGVVSAHRAMADVDVLVRTFQAAQRLGADLPAMLTRALRPKALVVSLAPYEDKALVKQHGFVWTEIVEGKWARRMPAEDAAALPFATRVQE